MPLAGTHLRGGGPRRKTQPGCHTRRSASAPASTRPFPFSDRNGRRGVASLVFQLALPGGGGHKIQGHKFRGFLESCCDELLVSHQHPHGKIWRCLNKQKISAGPALDLLTQKKWPKKWTFFSKKRWTSAKKVISGILGQHPSTKPFKDAFSDLFVFEGQSPQEAVLNGKKK